MPNRIIDPIKHCLHCGNLLTRKRYAGVLEKASQFLARMYCNLTCMAQARMLANPTLAAVRTRNRKVVKTSLQPACRDCQATTDLCLHHDDENPQNNAPSNLITLCRSCHGKEHMRRRLLQIA